MRSHLLFLTLLHLCSITAVTQSIQADQIDDALNKINAYAEGITALSQNKNEVASIKLREVASFELSKPAELRLLTRIAEAEVRAKNFEAALVLFETPGLASDPQASYWQAIALLGSERAGDAEKILSQITSVPDHPYWAEASLTRTSLLLRFGAPEEAIKLLTPLIQAGTEPFASRARLHAAEIRMSQKQWDDVASLLKDFNVPGTLPSAQLKYLNARLSLGKKEWLTARTQLQTLNTPEVLASLPPNMRDGSIICFAKALLNTGETEQATSLLRSFIDSSPDSPSLIIAFETLAELGLFKKDRIDEPLVNWSNSSNQNLASIATYFLAVAQTSAVNADAAASTLESVRSNFKDQPIIERALLYLSEIYVAAPNKPQALAVLADLKAISKNPEILARIAFIEAQAEYAAGDFKLAADKFALAAADKPAATAATFNSAIASLKTNDIASFEQRTQLLNSIGSTSAGATLQLERALLSARQGSINATEQLTRFLTDHPEDPRRTEAHLALAYLQLNQDFPKVVSARKHLQAARNSPTTNDQFEEADYISFWIEIADNNSAAAIAAGEKFVQNHPASKHTPEILFKLGSIHFRDGSFPAAQTNFNRIAVDYPTSTRAEIALFTAGRAAMRTGTPSSTENAVNIFTRVAELGGQFATSAKLQHALLIRSQLNEEKAIIILDSILKEKPTGEILFSTLITKGESLFVLSDKDPKYLSEAINVFNSIAIHPNVSTFWLNQSLTRKGNCLERAGKIDEALAAYEQVISRPRKPLAENESPEYVWLYKAGFAAIRIYEEKKNWTAAINTADILAATEGPGAQTARELSEKLETKNFLWRD